MEELLACSSDRPGWATNRELYVPEAFLRAASTSEVRLRRVPPATETRGAGRLSPHASTPRWQVAAWATALCCIYVHVTSSASVEKAREAIVAAVNEQGEQQSDEDECGEHLEGHRDGVCVCSMPSLGVL